MSTKFLYHTYDQSNDNMIIIFSSEQRNPTLLPDRVTRALFEWIDCRESDAFSDKTKLILPEVFYGFKHKNIEISS